MIFIVKVVLSLTVVVLSITSLIVGIVFIESDDNAIDCSIAEAPTELTLTSLGQYTTISWQSPELNKDCKVTYTLTYSIDGGDDIEIITTNSYYSMARVDACSSVSGNIGAISEEGLKSNGTVSYDYNNDPTANDIPTPQDVEVLPLTEGFQVTWSTAPGLSRCTVSFHVTLVADKTLLDSFDTDQESHIVNKDEYCFTGIVSVATVVSGVTGSSVSVTHEEKEALSGLGYSTSVVDSSDILTAFWDEHPRETDCSIQYTAVYSIAGEVQKTVRTTDRTAAFNMTYCVDGSVSVTANVLLILSNDEATIDVKDCDEE